MQTIFFAPHVVKIEAVLQSPIFTRLAVTDIEFVYHAGIERARIDTAVRITDVFIVVLLQKEMSRGGNPLSLPLDIRTPPAGAERNFVLVGEVVVKLELCLYLGLGPVFLGPIVEGTFRNGLIRKIGCRKDAEQPSTEGVKPIGGNDIAWKLLAGQRVLHQNQRTVLIAGL